MAVLTNEEKPYEEINTVDFSKSESLSTGSPKSALTNEERVTQYVESTGVKVEPLKLVEPRSQVANMTDESGNQGVKLSVPAGEAMNAGDIAYVATSGLAFKASAATFSAALYNYLGVVEKSVFSVGENVRLIVAGVAGGYSGLTIGSYYHLTDTAGAIGLVPGSVYRRVGLAISTTDIYLLPDPPTPSALRIGGRNDGFSISYTSPDPAASVLSVTIPGHKMGINGVIRVTIHGDTTSGANATIQIKLGNTVLVAAIQLPSDQGFIYQAEIGNRASEASQVGHGWLAANASISVDNSSNTGTENTAGDLTLLIQQSGSTATVRYNLITVEIIH